MTYHVEYEGYYAMSWHDREENALKRWFENFKIERHACFAADTEWLVVKELPSATRRKKRIVCEIGDDGRGTKREVVMDHTAPPAPILTFAAKRQYVAPPPKSPAELRKEAEWHRMMSMGYEPVRRRVPRFKMAAWDVNIVVAPFDFEEEYEIEWVPRRHQYYMPRENYVASPPPKHRRNV